MLDFFAIFSKSGIVLWCFQSTANLFTPAVNGLIKNIIIPEKMTLKCFEYDNLKLQYFLDNEFDLIFVVAYQKMLVLNYLDKFLSEIQLKFRDKYKNDLLKKKYFIEFELKEEFYEVYKCVENIYDCSNISALSKPMRTFQESEKSKKTIDTLVENKQTLALKSEKEKKLKKIKNTFDEPIVDIGQQLVSEIPVIKVLNDKDIAFNEINKPLTSTEIASKLSKKKASNKNEIGKSKKKEARKWDNEGTKDDFVNLDFSAPKPTLNGMVTPALAASANTTNYSEKFGGKEVVGRMKGNLKDIEDVGLDDDNIEEDLIEKNSLKVPMKNNTLKNGLTKIMVQPPPIKNGETSSSAAGGGGFFGLATFKNLVNISGASKSIESNDLTPLMDKLKQHLIAKNVAADVANKLCDSVGENLKGKTLGTFSTLKWTVKDALEKSLYKILSPNKRVDVLKDIFDARRDRKSIESDGWKPYVITFCGVNGVGKSTNLAKIAFWLIENDLRVLIAACDTFRSGAVEQLRTHARHLNSLHPPSEHSQGKDFKVQLYEKGYGKDAAGVAKEAIDYARQKDFDVVLVDTAGRMQDNEPLMRALAKLIKVNSPDLILFVGEALVGNEAIDQLVKFNRALADFSDDTQPRLIDGILLTKFDTIDDKVGAAISMTYISGQPILFVGTGQTYTDLKNLDAKSVIHALMKN